jgi:hypothetical protein
MSELIAYQADYVPYGWMEPSERRRRLILDGCQIHASTAAHVWAHPEVLATSQAQLDELLAARERCQSARFPELHSDSCGWCAFVLTVRGLA